MKCEECHAAISAWMDDELEDSAQGALFGHITECADCRAFLVRARKIERALSHERHAYYSAGKGGRREPASVLRRQILVSVSSLLLTLFLASFFALVMGVTMSRSRLGADQSSFQENPQQEAMQSNSGMGGGR